MVKIAFLTDEQTTKDLVYLMAKSFSNIDWCFRHFFKASQLQKASLNERYDLLICDELFETNRFLSVFQRYRIIFVSEQADFSATQLRKSHLEEDFNQIAPKLLANLAQMEQTTFTYGGTTIRMPISDIYYFAKEGKQLDTVCRLGNFARRLSMTSVMDIFEAYGFLRVHVSFLINPRHIIKVEEASVTMTNGAVIPISRHYRRQVKTYLGKESIL